MDKQRFLITTKDAKYLCVKGSYCWQVKHSTKKIKYTEVVAIERLNG